MLVLQRILLFYNYFKISYKNGLTWQNTEISLDVSLKLIYTVSTSPLNSFIIEVVIICEFGICFHFLSLVVFLTTFVGMFVINCMKGQIMMMHLSVHVLG